MAYETKPNTGALFVNDRRESDTHPNAKGSAVIGGVEYWVDAWTNTSQSGAKYQSLKFKPKDQQSQPKPDYPNYGGDNSDLGDDASGIPF